MLVAYLAFCWLLGITAADFAGDDALAIMLAAWLVALLWLAVALPRPSALLAAVGALLVVAGAWHYNSALPMSEPEGIAVYNDKDAIAFGAVVIDEPNERASSTRLRLSAREVLTDVDWEAIEGDVLAILPTFADYEYGDLLQIVGKLETPPQLEDFDYREYLARQGIASISSFPRVRRIGIGEGSPIKAAIFEARDRLGDALTSSLPEPQASLAEAILTGRRSALPEGLMNDLRVTGTSHIVAISGYNVSVVAGLLLGSLAWLIGRRQAAFLALAAVVGYALLSGFEPPVQRAAVMGGLCILATVLGRPNSAFPSLLLAAAAMTAAQPLLVRDVSFELSFAATLGLVLLAPALRDRVRSLLEERGIVTDGPVLALVDVLAVTFAAIAFTLPITAINFGTISIIAPVANVLVVPAFPVILITSALTALAGAVTPILGDALVWFAWPPLAYMTLMARLLADVPAASVNISGFALPHAATYYAVLMILTWALAYRRGASALKPFMDHLGWAKLHLSALYRLPTAGIAALLVLASVFVWLLVLNTPPARLSVTFLDIGQGDAIFIRTPAGHKILVDGGPSDEVIAEALGRYLPFWDRHLHLVVLTHPDAIT